MKIAMKLAAPPEALKLSPFSHVFAISRIEEVANGNMEKQRGTRLAGVTG
jgi:hypothetical protein